MGNQVIPMLNGESIMINIDNYGIDTVVTINENSVVELVDNMATNGVIHAINRGLVVINYLPNLLKRNIRAIAQRRPALVEMYPALRRARHISGRTSVIPASVHRFRPCPIPARSSQSSSQHQNRNRNRNQNQNQNRNQNRNRMLPVMVAIN